MSHQRLNVNQTPLPFSFDTKKTYELVEPGNPENRTKKVWVAEPHPGASKRFYSYNVCFRPIRTRLAVIFRGQGRRISEAEKQAWDKDIVRFIFKVKPGQTHNFL